MIKRILLFLVAAGLATAAQAQSGFTTGYVVTTAGDSLRGEVDVRGSLQNAETCRFRASPGTSATEYTPQQLRGYGISSPQRYYESRQLNGGKQVFAQVILLGNLSLYTLPLDNQNQGYFTRKQSDMLLIPLTQRDTVEVVYDNRQQREVRIKKRFPSFQPVLAGLMVDCYAAQSLIPQTQLKRSSLVKLFTVYNTCNQQTASNTVAEDNYRRVRLEILLGGGIDRVTYATYPAFSSDAHLQTGIGLQLNPEFFNPRLSVHLQALYSRSLLSQQLEVEAAGIFQGQTTREDVYARFQTVQVPLLVRVDLSRKALRPYLAAGPVGALNFDGEAYRTYYLPNSSTTSRNNFSLHSFSLGGVGAAGLSAPAGALGRVQLEGRMTWLGKLSQENQILGGHTKWSILSSFTFGR